MSLVPFVRAAVKTRGAQIAGAKSPRRLLYVVPRDLWILGSDPAAYHPSGIWKFEVAS